MDIYTTEEEQIQRIKKWLKEYGPTIVISILVVVAGTFGWRYWSGHENKLRAQASNYYEQLVSSAMSNDSGAAIAQAKSLKKDYPSTPYAKLAALMLAKQFIENGNLSEAKTQLRWVMDKSDAANLKQIARNRLARVYLAQKQPQKALKILKTVDDKAYAPAIEIIRGDAYVVMGNTNAARKAYSEALVGLPNKSNNRLLVDMKLHNLPAA